MLKSPTFFVGAERQTKNLQVLQRRDQQLAEAYYKNKPLCFTSRGYQKTHPVKARRGHRDADARLESPMILGVADGVSQIEDFGIDASLLPNELLKYCEDIGMAQLVPDGDPEKTAHYKGPIPLVRKAFEATSSLGSTTLVLAILDNSTRIHGKLHPMIAVISVGDCELLILRRMQGRNSPLVPIFHTEMQRIDGHIQTPLQLARVDDRIDPDFREDITYDVIERGSAVHCVSCYEGDIVVIGSDGVFDNLFVDEVAILSNAVLPAGRQIPTHEALLGHLAKRIIEASHAKTERLPNGQYPDAPIGRGGKTDDTSCVVAEVVEWTESHTKLWAPRERKKWQWPGFMNCGVNCAVDEEELEEGDGNRSQGYQNPREARESRFSEGSSGDEDEDDEQQKCAIS